MRESVVETKARLRVLALGGLFLKFVSPGMAGVPDRIQLMPVPPEHQELVARYVRFIEVKRPGGRTSKIQQVVHAMLRKMGFRVDILSSLE